MDFFDRQRRLKGFGDQGQSMLAKASVLIAGVGGLGCPVALYLAAAGVGELILADGDVVDASNLHRQVLFGVQDMGKNKAVAAAAKLQTMYPSLRINAIDQNLDTLIIKEHIGNVRVVVDASDRFEIRYVLNDCCYLANVPLVQGAVSGYEGTCSVFHYPTVSEGFDYRHVFPESPRPGEIPTCEEEGVLGVLPGVIGTMMAGEVIKIISGVGEVLSGKMLHYDLRSQQTYHIRLSRQRVKHPASWEDILPQPAVCRQLQSESEIGESERVFIDVRDPGEIDDDQPLKGLNIPLSSLINRRHEWECFPRLTVYCQSGVRSELAVRKMKELRPDLDIVQLEGGVNSLLKDGRNENN